MNLKGQSLSGQIGEIKIDAANGVRAMLVSIEKDTYSIAAIMDRPDTDKVADKSILS